MPWPLYPRRKIPRYPLDRRLDEPQSRSGRHGEVKFLPPPGLELWSLGRPARTQSLYRLRQCFSTTGPWHQFYPALVSRKKRIYRASVWQRLRTTGLRYSIEPTISSRDERSHSSLNEWVYREEGGRCLHKTGSALSMTVCRHTLSRN
jgi:hypothetical protein